MKLALLSVICVVWIGAATGASRIVACEDEQGVVWFTDLPCAGAREVREVSVSDITVIEIAKPTELEQRRLTAMQRLPDRPRQGQRGGAQPDEARLCAEAQRGLDELRDTRRRGYKVSQSAALDARERTLREAHAQWCP